MSSLQEILLFRNVKDCETARTNVPANRTAYRHIGTGAGLALPRPLMAFAVVNGFRNIQTVVQQIKRGHTKTVTSSRQTGASVHKDTPFDYVEIMACPKGELRPKYNIH